MRKQKHLTAMIYPASMLPVLKQVYQSAGAPGDDVVFLAPSQQATVHNIMLIAEEFVSNGRTVRIVRPSERGRQ